ncbi:MAG TPA: hypothetical protein VGF22_04045 [Acidimicrobiales bacterium]
MEDDAPYWKRAYGIGQPWRSSPRIRRGCIVGLGAAIVVIAVILLVALIVTVT